MMLGALCAFVNTTQAQEGNSAAQKKQNFQAEEVVFADLALNHVNLELRYEAFSMTLPEAAALQRQGKSDPESYAWIVQELGKKTKQEKVMMIRSRSGQKCTTEEIDEQIYPTEFESPKLPQSVSGSDGAPITPASPTAYETRNEGDTLEAEMTMGKDRRFVDLIIAPQHVHLLGHSRWGQGLSEVKMPTYSSNRTNTAVCVRVGAPFCLGTMSPSPRKQEADGEQEKRVWFVFITVNTVRL